jgi:hypothetical protein
VYKQKFYQVCETKDPFDSRNASHHIVLQVPQANDEFKQNDYEKKLSFLPAVRNMRDPLYTAKITTLPNG